MTRIRVPLGKFIKEYSERNKGNEDIPVYSVTNSQGFCTEYFGKEVASQDKTTYKIVPQGYFAYNPSRINVGSVQFALPTRPSRACRPARLVRYLPLYRSRPPPM